MTNTKAQTYTLSYEAIEKLTKLSKQTGLKKSTILTLLVNTCDADRLMEAMRKNME